jgi:site-specific DNA recombinase
MTSPPKTPTTRTTRPRPATRTRTRAGRGVITPEANLRVALYTRRSTDEEHQPYTIEAQKAKLAAYVASQPGWHVVAEFTDDASGATLDRPGLRRALAAANAGRFDLLLVYRLDRFSRRIRDLAALMDHLDAARVAFRSATEPFDTASPAGRLFVQMLGAFAEFEREVIIDRVINGMERKAAAGAWTNGPRPFGYRIHPDTGHLVPHPDERHTVTAIFTRYATTRAGTRAIADQLNAEGKRARTGKPWSGRAVGRILTSRLYLGELTFRDITATGAHEPLIDPATFETCQQILTARGETASRRAASNSDYHLTGLIACPACGHPYVGASANGRTRRYRYYTCYTRARYGPTSCRAPRIDADHLDSAVLHAMVNFYARTDLITAAVTAELALRADDADRDTAELTAITGQITTTQAAIDRYLTAFENGNLDERTCGQRIRDLATRLDQLTLRHDELTDLAQTPPAPPSPHAIAALREHLADVIAHGTPGQRKALIETHIAEITLDGDTLTPIFLVPTDPAAPGEDEGPTGTPADPTVRTPRQYVPPVGFEPALERF